MGFSRTSKNVLYLDKITNNIRYSSDIEFDEGGETNEVLSPNAKALSRRSQDLTAEEDKEFAADDIGIDVSEAPWINPKEVSIKLNDTNHRHPTGISYMQCNKMHRPFISTIRQAFKGQQLRHSRRKFLKAYIIAVNDQPVFTTADVDKLIAFYQTTMNHHPI